MVANKTNGNTVCDRFRRDKIEIGIAAKNIIPILNPFKRKGYLKINSSKIAGSAAISVNC
jgi:hypothetical protein